MMLPLIDVHNHLTHSAFDGEQEQVVERAVKQGLKAIVVNGLEAKSNRQVLELASEYEVVRAACGIYPSYAAHPDERDFDLWEEVEFIRNLAREGRICAVGECGLDAYHCEKETLVEQERVFVSLIEIAKQYDLPIIIHSRKQELRVLEILAEFPGLKVNMHCYTGKFKPALAAAEQGIYFSIPANCVFHQGFQKMLREFPEESLLCETDAPYLSPVRGTRNEPANVIRTVEIFAKLKQLPLEEAAAVFWKNFNRLFSISG